MHHGQFRSASVHPRPHPQEPRMTEARRHSMLITIVAKARKAALLPDFSGSGIKEQPDKLLT